MSWTHLRTEHVKKAQKDYSCDACYVMFNDLSVDEVKKLLTKEELIQLEKMESNGFKILKGEPYIKVAGVFEGDFGVSHYNPEMYKLAEKYNFFDDY